MIEKNKKRNKSFKNILGFTLIELLVVVSIIAILAGLVLVSFSTPQKQSKDTVRKNDLRQYATLLKEFAANSQGFYPCQPTQVPAATTLCSNLGLASTECPVDPINTSPNIYNYSSGTVAGIACAPTGGAANAANFVLYGRVEAQTNTQFVICSNGKSGTLASTSNHINGVCPL